MLNERNEWQLTPAYDLTFTHGPGGEHTMTVAGEERAPDRSHIMRIADGAGITKIRTNEIIGEVSAAPSPFSKTVIPAGSSTRANEFSGTLTFQTTTSPFRFQWLEIFPLGDS